MRCPSCQTENPDDNLFCRKCGAKFTISCPQCVAEVLPEDTFCGKCGEKLEKEVAEIPINYSQPLYYTPKFLADKEILEKDAYAVKVAKKLVNENQDIEMESTLE